MTSQIKAKLLQHFAAKKKADGGFTLIELLVVIIIIGILSAIALPSFLNQANKAKQSEAKTYVGSMNRAQQAYYLEKSEFASTPTELGLGITLSTENYSYSVKKDTGGSFATNKAESTKIALKGYAGGVALVDVDGGGTDKTTVAALCEATAAGTATPADATLDTANNKVKCPTGYETIK